MPDLPDLRKPILMLDFDGVAHRYTSGWKGADVIPDGPVDGLTEFLVEAVEVFDVQVLSSRSHQPGGTEAMMKWFGEHVPRSVCEQLKFPSDKPPAFIGLDDRVMLFEGKWPSVEELRKFEPWYRRKELAVKEEDTITIRVKAYLEPNGELTRVRLSKDGVELRLTVEQAKSFAKWVGEVC